MTSVYIMIGFVTVVCILIFTAKSDTERMMYVFFFIAFANVIKLDRNMSSLTLLFEAAMILTKFFSTHKLPKTPIAGALVIGAYSMIPYLMMGNFSPTLYVKVISWLFFMHYVSDTDNEANEKPFILAFAWGQLMAAIFGHFTSLYPAIKVYLNNQYVYVHGELGSSTLSSRYCGLLSDSNLYSVEILVTISLMLYLFYRKKIGKSFYPIVGALIVCSITSFSKTFILGLSLLVIAFIMVILQKSTNEKVMAVIIVTSGVAIFFEQLVEDLDIYSQRFADASSMVELTTNRSHLFVKFLSYMIENGTFVFGNGLKNVFLGRDEASSVGAHNAYIQFLHMLGLIGSTIAIICFVFCYRNGGKNRFKINSVYHAVPLITILYGMMTVDLFQYDFFMITFILVLYIYKVPAKKQIRQYGDGSLVV